MTLRDIFIHDLTWRFAVAYCLGIVYPSVDHFIVKAIICLGLTILVIKTAEKYKNEPK